MTTIQIYKKANGSLLSTPGDGVLFYTGDYSPRANAVSGIFIDNPPTLPADSAALIWRYYADTDRYVLVHVQGSHALFPAEGRNYPFRGAYEVTLSDVNALSACGRLPITSLFDAMPRIEDFQASAQRVESTTDISIAAPAPTDESRRLAAHIRAAIERGERLALSIGVAPSSLRANAVFTDPRLKTLLAAIEELPVAMARYATFAFNVDERHAAVTDDVLITIVPEGSAVAKAAGARPWAEVITTPAKTAPANIGDLALETLATAAGPLAATAKMLADMRHAVDRLRRIDAASPFLLEADELQLWLRLGHKLEEISIKKWSEATGIYASLNEAQRQRFVAIFKPVATTWNTQGFEHELYADFDFDAAARRRLRDLTFSEYFYKARHAFLFTDDEGRAYLDEHVTAELLERRLATECTQFSDVVVLFRGLPYVGLYLWRETIGDQPINLELIDPLPAIDDLPAAKQDYLRELHAQHLTRRLPATWKDFRKFLDEAQEDSFKREQLTLISPEHYAALIETDLEGKRSGLGRRLTPDEVRVRRYNELAKIGAAMLRKKYEQMPTTLADYATENVLPALLNFCKAQFSPILSPDAVDAETGQLTIDAYAVFCAICDGMSRYGDIWRVFRRQFVFWTPDEMPTLALLTERLTDSLTVADRKMTAERMEKAEAKARDKARKAVAAHEKEMMRRGESFVKGATDPDSLYVTPVLSEKSVVGKSKYRIVIINIAARLRQTKDSNLKTMASNLENKALTKRQRLYRKIMGNRPENPILHWLRAGIICALCALIGFGAAKLSERFAEKPDPAAIADSLRKDSLQRDSLLKDSLMQDYLLKDSLLKDSLRLSIDAPGQ